MLQVNGRRRPIPRNTGCPGMLPGALLAATLALLAGCATNPSAGDGGRNVAEYVAETGATSVLGADATFAGSPLPDVGLTGLFPPHGPDGCQVAVLQGGEDSFAVRLETLRNAQQIHSHPGARVQGRRDRAPRRRDPEAEESGRPRRARHRGCILESVAADAVDVLRPEAERHRGRRLRGHGAAVAERGADPGADAAHGSGCARQALPREDVDHRRRD